MLKSSILSRLLNRKLEIEIHRINKSNRLKAWSARIFSQVSETRQIFITKVTGL